MDEKKIKDMTVEEKREYNRLYRIRKGLVKLDPHRKKMKDMTPEELKEYRKLHKDPQNKRNKDEFYTKEVSERTYHSGVKLTEKDVKKIRERYKDVKETRERYRLEINNLQENIAKDYGVSQALISKIINNKMW